MDPVSVIGLVAALLQLIDVTAQTIRYINEVKDAPKQRGRLAREASGLLMLLTDLRYRVEEIDESSAWFAGVRSLENPLQLFKVDLENIAYKLRPRNTLRTAFGWPFEEKQINAILVKIERTKTLVGLALHKDIFNLSLHIKGQNDRIQHNVEEVLERVDDVQASQEEQTRKALYSWVSPYEFSTKQSDVLSRRQEGTGKWLLDMPEFKSWTQNSDMRTIWCPGIPGAGKTVLASIVVEHLEKEFHDDRNVRICYIYCSYKEHENHTMAGLIGNLLLQLIQRQNQIPNDIVTLYDKQKLTRAKAQLGELSSLLHIEIQQLHKVFFIIDALDECLEAIRYAFLEELVKSGAQLMVTSRYLSVVEHDFKFAARLEVRASDEDVRKYVEARMISERRMARHVRGDPTLSTKIVETLVESARGMFLLSQFHMDFLAKKSSKKDVREALNNLPATLDNTYDEAMRRIHQQDAEEVRLATQVLTWISNAFTSLRVRELQFALASVPGATKLDEEALPYEDDLVSVCAGLVDIDSESGVIRLVHYTTQKYFERNGEKWFGEASLAIARSSLIYLSLAASAHDFSSVYTDHDLLATHKSDPYLESTALCQEFPFAFYASCNWGAHARGQPETELKDLIIDFFQREANIYMLIVVLWPEYRMRSKNLPEAFQSIRTAFQYEVPGLFLATCYNLPHIVSTYLDSGVSFGKSNGSGTTALHVAAKNGHIEIATLLLDHGADVEAKGDETGRSGETPLHCAASEGHAEVVKFLCDHGANRAAESATGATALFLATAGDHLAAVLALLVDTILPEFSTDRDTCLIMAASRGYESIVRVLISINGNLEAQDSAGRTPLMVAIYESSPLTQARKDTVQLLLEKGANLEAQDHLGNTVVDYASKRGQEGLMDLMIKCSIIRGQELPPPKELNIDSCYYTTPTPPVSVGESGQHWWNFLMMKVDEYPNYLQAWFDNLDPYFFNSDLDDPVLEAQIPSPPATSGLGTMDDLVDKTSAYFEDIDLVHYKIYVRMFL
ncbi:hypothetical protein MMC17_008656 [Xylographa soralifera]|nr:hypothetical protein [Xylographa soralifera]